MRRLTKRKVTTKFKDDLGEFSVDTRLMKGSERARFLEANKALSESQNDPAKYTKAIQAIKEVVADICLTPGLDKAFWVSDDREDGVVLTVALNTLNAVANSVMEGVETFRPK